MIKNISKRIIEFVLMENGSFEAAQAAWVSPNLKK